MRFSYLIASSMLPHADRIERRTLRHLRHAVRAARNRRRGVERRDGGKTVLDARDVHERRGPAKSTLAIQSLGLEHVELRLRRRTACCRCCAVPLAGRPSTSGTARSRSSTSPSPSRRTGRCRSRFTKYRLHGVDAAWQRRDREVRLLRGARRTLREAQVRGRP